MIIETSDNQKNEFDYFDKILSRKKFLSLFLFIVLTFSIILTSCQMVTPANSSSSLTTASSINSSNSLGSSDFESEMSGSSLGSNSNNTSSPSPSLSPSPSPSPSVKVTPIADPTLSPTPEFTIDDRFMYINVGTANLRSVPSTDSPATIIKSMHYRTRVRRVLILNIWSKVTTDNEETGYVYTEFLSTTIPILTPTPPPVRTLTKWSDSSTLIEQFYNADIAKYIGNSKGTGFKPLKGITVILDPGHGGDDPGAVYESKNGYTSVYEKTINLKVANLTGNYLMEMGANVIYTRKDDKFYGLYYRNALINKIILENHFKLLTEKIMDNTDTNRLITLMDYVINKNNDLVSSGGRGTFLGLGVSKDLRTSFDISREYEDVILISIHCNSAFNAPFANGLEVYYGTNNAIFNDEKLLLHDEPRSNPYNPEYQFYNDSLRHKLSKSLISDIQKQTSLSVRGTTNGLYPWNFCLLRENNLTSALLELGYLSNNQDRTFLSDPAGQNMIALGIANGIFNYFCTENSSQ